MPHKDLAHRREYHKEYYKKNKTRLADYRKTYRMGNPDKERLWQDSYRDATVEERKWKTIKRRYGLEQEDFTKLLTSQKGCCAICAAPFLKTPHIDHCHSTGKIRGLLCGPCNTGLGVYEKKKHLFERYLHG